MLISFIQYGISLKLDVYKAVQDFFRTRKLFSAINCTSITLILKSLHASSISRFRPISCCIVLYKIIAKILMARMHVVMKDVVDVAQVGFILDRKLLDNALLALKLIKGYGREYMSPKCMVKIDLRKAYDSIE